MTPSDLERFCVGTNFAPSQLRSYFNPRRQVTRHEHLHRLHDAWEVLFWQAVRVRKLARSYRGFNVGCAVFAYRGDPDVHLLDRWKVFYGMNTKVEANSRPLCAEPIAVNAAYAAGYTEIIGMMIVGEPQDDHHSSLHTPTLHPCHECRLTLKSHPITPLRTRIVTAQPPLPQNEGDIIDEPPRARWEIHTLSQILKLHGET